MDYEAGLQVGDLTVLGSNAVRARKFLRVFNCRLVLLSNEGRQKWVDERMDKLMD
jgi:hypothetical protein